MSQCERMQELISAMLDGELTEAESAEVKAHIASCADCAALCAAFSDVSAAIQADAASDDLPDTLHAGIMEKLHAVDAARKTQSTIVRLRPVLAAAACLVVLVGTVLALNNTLGRGKSAEDAPMAAAPALYTSGGTSGAAPAGGSAPTAAKGAADEGSVNIAESKMAAPEAAPEPVPEPAAARKTPQEENVSFDAAINASAAEPVTFTLRVTEQTAEGNLIGIREETGETVTVCPPSPGDYAPGSRWAVTAAAGEDAVYIAADMVSAN